MAVAEPSHQRGKPKKRTRVVPPPKGTRGPPCIEQHATAEQSMLVPAPGMTVSGHPHSKQGTDKMRALRVAKNDHFPTPLARLRKAAKRGEGSRGGHIIGHTKSGRPVYGTAHPHYQGVMNRQGHTPMTHFASDGHKAVRSRYDGFGKQDHLDASDIHSRLGIKARADHAKAIATVEEQTFGHRLGPLKHYTTGGYGASGGHPAMSVAHRDKLNELVHRAQDHELAARLHAKAANLRNFSAEAVTKNHDDLALERLRKAAKRGEGSHGGKIIGHTKSGKPIYDHSHASYKQIGNVTGSDHRDPIWHGPTREKNLHIVNAKHADYDRADHLDAAMLHSRLGSDLSGTPSARHASIAQAHMDHAGKLSRIHKSAKRGEGSHGGHIIGHTRSGKPVYGRSSPHNAEGLRGGPGADELASGFSYDKAARVLRGRYKDFSSVDHLDAARAHYNHASKMAGQGAQIYMTGPLSTTQFNNALLDRDVDRQGHQHLARAHLEAAKMARKTEMDI